MVVQFVSVILAVLVVLVLTLKELDGVSLLGEENISVERSEGTRWSDSHGAQLLAPSSKCLPAVTQPRPWTPPVRRLTSPCCPSSSPHHSSHGARNPRSGRYGAAAAMPGAASPSPSSSSAPTTTPHPTSLGLCATTQTARRLPCALPLLPLPRRGAILPKWRLWWPGKEVALARWLPKSGRHEYPPLHHCSYRDVLIRPALEVVIADASAHSSGSTAVPRCASTQAPKSVPHFKRAEARPGHCRPVHDRLGPDPGAHSGRHRQRSRGQKRLIHGLPQ
jgi:hypothetical protein